MEQHSEVTKVLNKPGSTVTEKVNQKRPDETKVGPDEIMPIDGEDYNQAVSGMEMNENGDEEDNEEIDGEGANSEMEDEEEDAEGGKPGDVRGVIEKDDTETNTK